MIVKVIPKVCKIRKVAIQLTTEIYIFQLEILPFCCPHLRETLHL